MDTDEVLDWYTQTITAEGRTAAVVAERRRTLRRLERETGVLLAEQTCESVDGFLAGRTAQGRQHLGSTLRLFYDWAVREGLVESNPAPPSRTLGPHPLPFEPSEADMVAAYEEHLRHRGLAPATIRPLVLALGRLRRSAGPLLTVEPEMIEAYLLRFSSRTSSRTTELSRLRIFYRWVRRAGYFPVDPTADVIPPQVGRRLPRPISEVDLERAVIAPTHVRPILLLAGWAGLRAREIGQLRPEHLLLDAPTPMVVVLDGKCHTDRIVPLGEWAVAELRGCGFPSRGWLFPKQNAPGEHRDSTSISRAVSYWFAELGIESSLRQLRHRFGTEIYRATLDLRLTQELMGHRHPATTALYTFVAPIHMAAAVDLLPTFTPATIDVARGAR